DYYCQSFDSSFVVF
nr:immunoglobulin light chain junction region [Macaca mulatta]MOX18939.1 immunoglobulin light chain junction region [Macaca mulatta]MOX20036.1 immunoglobulin light chain junction region [Macaca mulatta]MOX22013.1 immunoglobulin light chain junction region [Macaca mulatta]MOX22270.1 immunoglobulin light chain junction region [Macaca mulatta]